MGKNMYLLFGGLIAILVITFIVFTIVKLYKKFGNKVFIPISMIIVGIIAVSVVVPKIQQANKEKEAERKSEQWQIAYDNNKKYETDTAQRIAADLYDTDLRTIAGEFKISVMAHDCVTETIYFESIGMYSLCAYSDEKYNELFKLGESVSTEFTKYVRAKYDQSGDIKVYVFFMGNFIYLNGVIDAEKTADYYDVNREP